MLKRVFLFLLTNILVIATISIVLNLLGIGPYLTANGIDYSSLAGFCLVWGMGGAFISLLLSKTMAKWMLGVQVLDSQRNPDFQWLINMVADISRRAGLPKTPEVGIYDRPEVNAFATGASKSNSMVAFSTGILRAMDRQQLEAVAAHEVAHIANGDMVTMTLLQGVINAFVMFLARVIAFAISQGSRDDGKGAAMNFFVVIFLDIVLGILGSMVVFWFSRQREFRADAGSAKYVGKNGMISALKLLGQFHQPKEQNASLATLKIAGSGGMMRLFASHPPIEERIAALQQL